MQKKIISTGAMLALGTALISGASGFVNKFAVTAMKDPVLFATLKNSLVAIVFVGIILALGKHKEIHNLTSKQWIKLFAIGAIGGALPFALFFTGLTQTTAVNGALIHKTLFLWVALIAIPLLKEKMVWQQWLGIVIVFIGNLFVGGFTGFKFNAGEIMILSATVLWAIENVIAKKALEDISSIVVASARMIIGSALLLGYIAIFKSFSPVFTLNSTQWGWAILTAILLCGYVVTWYSALKRAPATFVATLLVPATIVTNFLSAIFVTHKIVPRDLISTAFYSVGIVLVIYFARKTASSSKLSENTEMISI